ncbi:Protein translocase subunit SecY [Geodia barretti]|uniref:Protein translocase subunit SecY n=1 Tax=Geodia barretti TaxID=519541 RepID=A0AA35RBD9_GEOBA|nr:Protein translocase subunit SecY [Geodia barretti]
MQILVPAIPSLKAISQEGDLGRQKINQITHYATVPIAFLQSWGQLTLLRQSGVLPGVDFGFNIGTLAMLVSMVAGTMFLVWLGELISERGLGNGISLIIFAGIVANFPTVVGQGLLEGGQGQAAGLLAVVALGFGIIYVIVLFNEAQRRVPVQYGRSIYRGGQMQRHIIILPATIFSYFQNPLSDSFFAKLAKFFTDTLDPSNLPYWIAVFILVVIFTFFYTLVVFQQQSLAENLQRNGGFIPGIRPGRPTQEYLNRVIIRITWGGALFLGVIAIIPFFVTWVTDVRALTLSSTSLLIMVGVALDTMRQLEAQLLMRNYEGFIR